MTTKQEPARRLLHFVVLLLTLSVMMAGCGTPTQEPQPTFVLQVSPGAEVEEGDSVAIVAEVSPLEKLELEWSVSGTAEGTLDRYTGEQVVYTAGEEGTDIVVAEGTTASGAPVKQTVSLTVVKREVVAEAPTPTDTPVPPTDTPSVTEEPAEEPTEEATEESPPEPTERPKCSFDSHMRIPIAGPPVDAEVRITSMEHCADNLPTATAIPLAGTYSGDMTDKEIWILVYPTNLVYYPQSTNACANLSTPSDSGQWQEQIRLGRQGVPEAFHVVAVVAEVGSPASEAFHNYLTVGCDTGNYEGLAIIPSGATEMDSIIVHTQ